MSMDTTEPIIDGHNDLLLRLSRTDEPIAAFVGGDEDTHVDLPRAREAGLGAGFFASFVPGEDRVERRETDDGYEYPLPDPLDRDRASRATYEMLALLHRLDAEVEGFRVVRTVDDLEACLDAGVLGAVAHLEGAAGVAPDLSNLDLLYAAGVRSIGPVWSRPNAFGHGVRPRYPGDPDTGSGLTDAGRDLVRACEERGILVDCAHLNARGFRDVVDLTDAPPVVSHAGAHEIYPHSRNLTDEQLDAVAGAGGVVGVTFSAGFLGGNGDPNADVPLDALVDHVEHVANRAGVDHVALGSDFDGARIPDEVGDVTGLPAVLAGLRDRGFDDGEIERIARGNWLRVLREVW